MNAQIKILGVSVLLLALALGAFAADNAGAPKKLPWSRSVRDNLVNQKGENIDRDFKKYDYVLIYYSAHWCGACKAFTPKLVEFYNKHAKEYNFEIIFASFDRSPKDMLAYMKEADMPWPAVKQPQVQLCGITDYVGKGIPCLVVFGKDGKLLINEAKKKYIFSPDVLKQFEALAKENNKAKGQDAAAKQ